MKIKFEHFEHLDQNWTVKLFNRLKYVIKLYSETEAQWSSIENKKYILSKLNSILFWWKKICLILINLLK